MRLEGEKKSSTISLPLSHLLLLLLQTINRSYDSFFPKDGDVLVPDLTRNVGSLPLGLNVAESIFSAGNGLAPKFVGMPVQLPPAPSSSAAAAAPLSPVDAIDRGFNGMTRAPSSAGAEYEPIPGLGEVSGYFICPRQK